jgi:hypothetical protein
MQESDDIKQLIRGRFSQSPGEYQHVPIAAGKALSGME